MDVDVGDLWAEEEGSVDVGGVDEFGDFGLEFFGVLGLFVEVLGLEELVEGWDDVAVYLWWCEFDGLEW